MVNEKKKDFFLSSFDVLNIYLSKIELFLEPTLEIIESMKHLK